MKLYFSSLRTCLILLCVTVACFSSNGWFAERTPKARFQLRTSVDVYNHIPFGNTTCELCRLPSICFTKTGLRMPLEAAAGIQKAARRGKCFFRKAGTLLSEHAIELVPLSKFPELTGSDVLNPGVLLPVSKKTRSMFGHIPHYLEHVFLPAVRSITLLDKFCKRWAWYDTSCVPGFQKMRLLYVGLAYEKEWITEIQQYFIKAFPSVTLHESKSSIKSCYRSAVLSRCKGVPSDMLVFQRRISRILGANNMPKGNRTMRVGILSRERTREIVDVERVRRRVLEVLLAKGIAAICKILFFERTPFEYQAREMAGLDVVIASHGAGNTNIVFMRKGGLFIEIVPFPGGFNFRQLSQRAGLRYVSIVAEPDERRVMACARETSLNATSFAGDWASCRQGSRAQCVSKLESNVERRTCLRRQSLLIPEPELEKALKSHVQPRNSKTKNSDG